MVLDGNYFLVYSWYGFYKFKPESQRREHFNVILGCWPVLFLYYGVGDVGNILYHVKCFAMSGPWGHRFDLGQ